jgi:glucose/mannose transport system substrate-binding protein
MFTHARAQKPAGASRMKIRIRCRLGRSLALGAALCYGMCGCSSSPADNSSQLEDSLEIFSWWTSAGEVDALNALLDVYRKKNKGVDVTNAAAVDPTNARETLKTRLESGDPPDSFQAISGVDVMSWVANGKMKPISDLASENGWGNAFPSAVTDILKQDGQLFAVPVNIERDNNLYYNTALLQAQGVEPPATLADFYAACGKLQAASVTPLAVPAAGWVLALVAFETLMPSVNGGDFYVNFFNGNADPNGPELRQLFQEFAKILVCSNVASASDSWGVSGDLVYSGKAAMFVMGDWAKGYFEGGKDANGIARPAWQPGVDFGVVPGLGGAGYFTFNSAVFGLPYGAVHPNAGKAFLSVVGSAEGQQAFNPLKGSVPARTDADLSLFDAMVRASAEDFKAASTGSNKLLPGYASLTTLDFQEEINPSLLVFALGGDRARTLDSADVPIDEADVPALDVDYIVAKIAANYGLLRK